MKYTLNQLKFQNLATEMDIHLPPPQPHATTTAHGCATGNDLAVENLKSLLMKCAIASSPGLEQKAFLEKRIQDFALTVHTPDHPPYAWVLTFLFFFSFFLSSLYFDDIFFVILFC